MCVDVCVCYREERAEKKEQRPESREQKAERRKQKAESREQKAESREQKVESREQRAASREHREQRAERDKRERVRGHCRTVFVSGWFQSKQQGGATSPLGWQNKVDTACIVSMGGNNITYLAPPLAPPLFYPLLCASRVSRVSRVIRVLRVNRVSRGTPCRYGLQHFGQQ
jgi:hypothetical protein